MSATAHEDTAQRDTADTMWTVLRADFGAARRELAEARIRKQQKDTPDNRADVARALTRVDAVLDTYLDVHAFLRGPAAAPSAVP
jgi:hypothetical protein